MRRHRIVRCALEHRQVLGLLRNDRDRLDRGRPRADDADALPGEIHALMRPARGAVDRALERLEPGEGHIRRNGETPCREDQMPAAHGRAIIRRHIPNLRRVIPVRRGHPRVEPDVALQVEPLGHMLGIFQQLRLRRIPLGPAPFLLQLLIEAEAVFQALDIHPRAGIPVPVPGPADAAARFHHLRIEAQPAQLVQHVHARKPRPDNQGIDRLCRCGRRRSGHGDILPHAAAQGIRLLSGILMPQCAPPV